MPYAYSKVDDLDGQALVGTGQCAVLVETFAGAPKASEWTQGAAVRGHLMLAKGTAIATFVDGVYKNRPHGNHAALYLSQDQGGIWVMDQWQGDVRKPTVSRHYLQFRGRREDGSWIDTGNNGNAFSVIE